MTNQRFDENETTSIPNPPQLDGFSELDSLDDLNDEFVPQLCTLIDEDDNEQQFEILHTLTHNGEEYYALLPYTPPDLPIDVTQQIDPNEVFVVMRLQLLEDGSEGMASIDDDDEYDLIGGMFLEAFAELYEQECERLEER